MDKKSETKNECPSPRGILVAIGGKENRGEDLKKKIQQSNESRLEILKQLLSLCPKKSPHLEIITTASAEGNDLYQRYHKAFRSIGFESINHIHHSDRNAALSDTGAVERIKKADVIFFSGGDQLKLTIVYGGTSFFKEMKLRYVYEELLIAGTSAGAMALSTPMIFSGPKDVQQIAGEVKITTGLEFLKDVCIDTHFVDRGRFVRMAQVIATNPSCLGVGIEEDTALVIREGVEASVIGSGVVTLIDGRKISATNLTDYNMDRPVSIRGLQVDLLSQNDTFCLLQTNPPHR